MLAKETREKIKTHETLTFKGRTFRVKRRNVYTHTHYAVDGQQWVEPTNAREEKTYLRSQLPHVHVNAVHLSAVSEEKDANGKRSRIVFVEVTTTGDYANVCDYVGELAETRGVCSFRNRSGIVQRYVLL